MLSGRRTFQRATVTDTLVAVLGEEPDWSLLPGTTPAPVRSVLRRCLQRDRDRRYHDMADVRIEIDDEVLVEAAKTPPVSAPASGSKRKRLAWALAAFAGGVVVASGAFRMLPRDVDTPVQSLDLPLDGVPGLLVYREPTSFISQLTWLDRGGRPVATVGEPGNFVNLALNRDENRVAGRKWRAREGSICGFST